MRRKYFFLAPASKFATNKARTTGGSVRHLSVPLLNQSVSWAPVLCHRQQTWPTGSSCSRCGGRGLCQETGSTSARLIIPRPPPLLPEKQFFIDGSYCLCGSLPFHSKNKPSLPLLGTFFCCFFLWLLSQTFSFFIKRIILIAKSGSALQKRRKHLTYSGDDLFGNLKR